MFKKILVPVDPAEPAFAEEALKKAAQFSREHGSKVHLLGVCPEVQSFVASQLPEGFQAKEERETRKMLDELAKGLDLVPEAVDTEVRTGSVYHEVIDSAQETGCDLVLMTSHKPGLATYFIGSNAAHIVRHAPCSLMVLRG